MENVFFAGGDIRDQNKGCQALGFGGIEFIRKEKYRSIVIPYFNKKRKQDYSAKEIYNNIDQVEGRSYDYTDILVAYLEIKILNRKLPKNKLSTDIIKCDTLFNASGGDSFSDIYGVKQYFVFALPSLVALLFGLKLVLLPQTIGPYNRNWIRYISKKILKKAHAVYVRDTEFVDTLNKWKVSYKVEFDLSSNMKPATVNSYEIKASDIGFNISGLTYFNNYTGLAGHFDNYPELCVKIVQYFQSLGKNIWLVPHTYIKVNPSGSDDLNAIQHLYMNLHDKRGVYIIDEEHNAMELKYIISKFSFFIGTRMHSCFAGIFSNVPTFGLAYSYKYKGSFDKMGLSKNYYDINYLTFEDIDNVVLKISNQIKPL